MIPDPKDKNQAGKTKEITKGNNPNDDEEILKNNDESNNRASNTDEPKELKDNDKKQGSETVGIP